MEFFFKSKAGLALVAIVLAFSILRLPSLIEPSWYNDEGIYQVIGKALLSGRVLYRDIWDNKPPLFYMFYAVFNSDLFAVRSLSLLFGVGALVSLYALSIKLFKKALPALVTTGIFAYFLAIPLIEGNIANAENFILFPIILGVYFFFEFLTRGNRLYIIISGLLFSLALLIKIVAIFDIAALIVLFVVLESGRQLAIRDSILNILKIDKKRIKEIVVFIISCSVLPLLSFVYFLTQGALGEYVRSMFSYNVGYVVTANDSGFPMGIILAKIIFLIASLVITIFFRKQLGTVLTIIFVWTAFTLFNAFFSQRPYGHYILVTLPPLSLLVGSLFYNTNKKILIIAFLLPAFIFINSYFTIYKKNLAYYKNYIDFLLGNKSVASYQAFFDPNTPTIYKVANFIKLQTRDSEGVFFWSDRAQLYYLSDKLPPGRYIVDYHVASDPLALSESIAAVKKASVKYIVDNGKEKNLDQFLDGYELRYKIGEFNIYERR